MNTRARATQAPYADASGVGVLLGFVLLAAFVFAGRGLGASGAFADVVGALIDRTAPALVTGRPALADRLPSGVRLADEWIVWEIVGVCAGAALSAWLAGRWGSRSANATGATPNNARVARAVVGGVLMGIGARLAYGCTSGLALSGGALMATGAWLFIAVAFATATFVGWLLRSTRKDAA